MDQLVLTHWIIHLWTFKCHSLELQYSIGWIGLNLRVSTSCRYLFMFHITLCNLMLIYIFIGLDSVQTRNGTLQRTRLLVWCVCATLKPGRCSEFCHVAMNSTQNALINGSRFVWNQVDLLLSFLFIDIHKEPCKFCYGNESMTD